MKKTNKYTVKFRRKREGKTDYKKRMALISSGKPRLVARVTLTRIIAQVIDFDAKGDKVLVATDSTALKKNGWKGSCKNIPAAYLTGYLLGNLAKKSKIKNVVLDIGLHTSMKGGKLYATLKGAVDAGLDINCEKSIFPTEDRIKGKHIKDFDNDVDKIKEKL